MTSEAHKTQPDERISTESVTGQGQKIAFWQTCAVARTAPMHQHHLAAHCKSLGIAKFLAPSPPQEPSKGENHAGNSQTPDPIRRFSQEYGDAPFKPI